MSTESGNRSVRIDEIAADWLARQDGACWSAEDQAAFEAWQNESTLHRVAVIRLRAVWRHADRLQALGAGATPGEVPPRGRWQTSALEHVGHGTGASWAPDRSRPVWFGRLKRFGLAAGLAACALLAVVVLRDAPYGPDTYGTEVGDTEVVALADGSRVTLNTNSKIRVAFSEGERRIELQRGEAFFDVAKNPSRPFVVSAGDKRIVAVGTRFSVLRQAEAELRVVVTEGRIRVEQERVGSAQFAPVQIAAGGVARAGAAGVVVTEHSLHEVEQALSWRSGYIVLREATLADAVSEFNRYNERQLEIVDPALAGLRIGGNLRSNNLDAFVRVIEQGYPIEAEVDGDRILLRAR